MKSEDTRITDYALGELRGAARADFEKELAVSEEMQRELVETIAWCERLDGLPAEEGLLDEQRAALRDECLKNTRIARRRIIVRRAVVAGSLAALAACLLIMPLTPWFGQRAIISAMSDAKAPAEAKLDGRLIATAATPPPVAEPMLAPGADRAVGAMMAAPAPVPQSVAISANNLSRTILLKSPPVGAMEVADASRARFNTEAYDALPENGFLSATENPLSTFSIDVDTASYANVRRFLQSDSLPPHGAVRIEELVNYFTYDYPPPTDGKPFSVNVEVGRAPWSEAHELVRIGLKGRDIPRGDRGPANLVFLIDVSGSMESENKLPLLRRSLQALVQNLVPEDRVAIVVYAGSSGLVLPSTDGRNKERILAALDELSAGGSTNGAQGIQLAYATARENFQKGGNNRVILCTDGDFNVGVTNQSDLVNLIERERASGVFLSVLGFGEGNLKDSTMEKLADKGNGNYAYIDSFSEARKVLVEQMNATLFTIAKDVKIQVEFNPAKVAGYRLIGYENRMLAKEDFNDDKKDAGEIGAGHAVTALYEVVPAGQALPGQPSVDPLKYQKPASMAGGSDDLLTVKLRYKKPDGDRSELIERVVKAGEARGFDKTSADFQFATAVAAYGMKLRGSIQAGNLPWATIQKIARRNLGEDPGSYRAEFLTLVEKAARLEGANGEK